MGYALALVLTGTVLGLCLAVEMHWISPPVFAAYEVCQ